MKALKLVQIASVEYAQLMGLGLDEKGVRACNGRGVFDVPIAAWNMAMMVSLARNLRGMIRNQESRLGSLCYLSNGDSWINCRNLGLWRNPARDGPAGQGFRHGSPRDVARARETTARRIPCAGHQRYGRRVAGQAVHRGPELKFLAGLDFLILALPLTKRTHGLIGERQLQALPRTSFVLNPARGPIIQEHVLVKALQEGWIAGAALDTHYHYPMPADHPLWQFPNVVLHAAYFRILIEPTLSGAYLGNFSE